MKRQFYHNTDLMRVIGINVNSEKPLVKINKATMMIVWLP